MSALQIPAYVYLLCTITSVFCLGLLVRGYRRTRVRLLLWSALCFVGLALNNLLLFVDIVILPNFNLLPARHLATGLALTVLLYGFIWEVD